MKTTFLNTEQDKNFMQTVINVLSDKRPTHAPVQINEKLDYSDAEEVEYGWNHTRPAETDNAIRKVFGDKSRIEFPLHTHDEVPHPDVEEHLNNHGYAITDYVGGKAKDKYNREVNIGKALTKTNATSDIKSAYDNDPTRQQKKSGLKVVISHSPVDVAGMTSGHQSWVNQSCMNFNSGGFRHHLKDDVCEGTHVAYLTDHDDNDLDRPVARIAVKPYHSDEGHTIFRPEDRVFGDASSSFHKNVNDWFEKHYPAHEDTRYEKNKHVYDDTGNTSYHALTKDSATKSVDANVKISSPIPQHVVDHIANHLIKKQIENPIGSTMDDFAYTGHKIAFSRNQVNALYKVAKEHGQNTFTRNIALKAGDTLNKQNLQHAVANYPDSSTVLRHKHLPADFIDGLSPEKLSRVHPNNLKLHHIDKIVDNYMAGGNGSYYQVRDVSSSLTPEHLKKIGIRSKTTNVNGEPILDSDDIRFALQHEKSNKDVSDHIFKTIKSNKPAMSPDDPVNSPLTVFMRTNKYPTHEHVASANTTGHLNDVMTNAKDKLTHTLAFNKAMDFANQEVQPNSWQRKTHVRLTQNSEKFLTDDHVKEVYDNLGKVLVGSTSNDFHEKLLNHSMSRINELSDKLHPKDMFAEPEHEFAHHSNPHWSELYNEQQKHFDKHADLIDDKLADVASDSVNNEPIDEKLLNTLETHINHAYDHEDHDGSHDDVRDKHQGLLNEIESRYNY